MGLIEPILLTGGRLASPGEDAPCIEDRGIKEILRKQVCAFIQQGEGTIPNVVKITAKFIDTFNPTPTQCGTV